MITPPNKIQDAINEAENTASVLRRDNEPVTVTNKCLLTLIEAAKELMEAREPATGTPYFQQDQDED